MANAIYPLWLQALWEQPVNSDANAGTVKLALVDTGTYTYNSTHQFYSDLSGVVGTDVTVGSKTFTNGAFDFADPTWSTVSGATVEAIVAYIDTGVSGTSRLIAYLDTGITGLPVTPNGGDITLAVAGGGFLSL